MNKQCLLIFMCVFDDFFYKCFIIFIVNPSFRWLNLFLNWIFVAVFSGISWFFFQQDYFWYTKKCYIFVLLILTFCNFAELVYQFWQLFWSVHMFFHEQNHIIWILGVFSHPLFQFWCPYFFSSLITLANTSILFGVKVVKMESVSYCTTGMTPCHLIWLAMDLSYVNFIICDIFLVYLIWEILWRILNLVKNFFSSVEYKLLFFIVFILVLTDLQSLKYCIPETNPTWLSCMIFLL